MKTTIFGILATAEKLREKKNISAFVKMWWLYCCTKLLNIYCRLTCHKIESLKKKFQNITKLSKFYELQRTDFAIDIFPLKSRNLLIVCLICVRVKKIYSFIYGHVCSRLTQLLLSPEHWFAISHFDVDLHQPQLRFSSNAKHVLQLLPNLLQLYTTTRVSKRMRMFLYQSDEIR